MKHSESIKELATALAKAQGQMEAASKDHKNQFGGVYADLGSIIEAAKQPLASNGLCISQHPEIEDGRVSVTTILMHASGEWMESSISSTVRENNALSAAQQAGIVITYLRRYSLASIVGIYADEDTDGADKAQKSNGGKSAAKPVPPVPIAEIPEPELSTADIADLPSMSIETANAVMTSDKTPRSYGSIDSDTLAHMATSIQSKLFKHGYPDGQTETAEYKLAAIKVILNSRQKVSQASELPQDASEN